MKDSEKIPLDYANSVPAPPSPSQSFRLDLDAKRNVNGLLSVVGVIVVVIALLIAWALLG